MVVVTCGWVQRESIQVPIVMEGGRGTCCRGQGQQHYTASFRELDLMDRQGGVEREGINGYMIYWLCVCVYIYIYMMVPNDKCLMCTFCINPTSMAR